MRICLRKKENEPGPKCVKDLATGGRAAADEGDVADGIKSIELWETRGTYADKEKMGGYVRGRKARV